MRAKTKNKPYCFNWRKLGSKYLLTNDFGNYFFAGESVFRELTGGRADGNSSAPADLRKKGFVRNRMDFKTLCETWRRRNAFLQAGPGLHILVMTLRCNHNCPYCQSGALPEKGARSDMNFEISAACVDFAFRSPSPSITLEFQGGEPLLNWGVLKRTITYARRKEKESGKNLLLALVTNFSLMDGKKADFLLKSEVSLCTSLDGPKAVHDKNRPYPGGSSHDLTVKWLKYFREKHDTQKGNAYRIFKPSALLTVTRFALNRPEEIVDEYVKHGLEDIFIRPMTPIGYAARIWGKIGYTGREFLKFYERSLCYALKLYGEGVRIREKNAALLLEKIINGKDPGYVDLRSPCGAATGQMAYDWNGDIYTCDEGRMLAREGDDTFKIGNARGEWEKIFKNDSCQICVLSSNLERQPRCFRCAYKPYCGVCPVYNWEAQRSIWGDMAVNSRCMIYRGIFDLLFKLLKGKKAKILKSWVAEK